MPSGTRILVIDDDVTVRSSLVAYLKKKDFVVVEAEDGEQGLEVFSQQKLDMILCDLRMPKLDGLSVLSEVRKKSKTIPFLVVSGTGVINNVVEALRLGANDFIVKPIIDFKVLEHAIWRALAEARLEWENRHYQESLEKIVKKLEANLAALKADQNAGRQVQKKMLPQTPMSFGGYQLNHHIFPSLYLSGDFVDYFSVGKHRFAFYLADVSGHGASSAFVTVLIKHMSMELRREYLKLRRDDPIYPSEVLGYINRGLLQTGLGKHVTIFGGVIDLRDNHLTYSFGGHFPMPIFCTEKGSYFLEGSGLPTGLFADAKYEDISLALPDKFSLTVFSDGILEVLPQAKLKDKEAYLLQAVKDCGRSTDSLRKGLNLDELIIKSPDDVALMVLSRNN